MGRHRRHRRATVGVGTPDIIVGIGPPDQVIVGYDSDGKPCVGSFWGSLGHALNPVNVAKTAWNVATIPYKAAYQAGKGLVMAPVNVARGETQALANLFRDPSSGGPRPQSASPDGYYPPGQQPWSAQPYAQQPGAPQYMNPPGGAPPFAPQYGAAPSYNPAQYPPQYDPSMYAQAPPDYGPDPTGWNAAYGSGE